MAKTRIHGQDTIETGTPVTQALGDAAAIGTSLSVAGSDHVHGMPSAAVVAVATQVAHDTGFVNGDFALGDGSAAAVSEVALGSNTANYASSLSATALPYWVVSQANCSIAVIADSKASNGIALQFLATGATQTGRIYQDIPLPAEGWDLSGALLAAPRVVAFSAGTLQVKSYYSLRKSDHTIIGSRTAQWDSGALSPFTDADYSSENGAGPGISIPGTTWSGGASEAYYLRYEIEVILSASGTDYRIDWVRHMPGSALVSSLAANSLQAGLLSANWTTIGTSTALLSGGGTSFPASPATNDRYYRTDLAMEFFYNGTRWLSTTLYKSVIPTTSTTLPINATAIGLQRLGMPILSGGSDLWVEDLAARFYVSGGGSALGASHKWVGAYTRVPSTTALATVTINSGASTTWRTDTQTVNALTGATDYEIEAKWTKTGTPGALYILSEVTYRIVAT